MSLFIPPTLLPAPLAAAELAFDCGEGASRGLQAIGDGRASSGGPNQGDAAFHADSLESLLRELAIAKAGNLRWIENGGGLPGEPGPAKDTWNVSIHDNLFSTRP